MKVCVPHMGTLYVPIRALFEGVGAEVVVPPPCTRRTLSLGTKYSPEFVCLPYKLVMGNFIEALEMGADTLVMIEGDRICRLGYYMRVMEGALRDLGYDFQLITTRIFQRSLVDMPNSMRVFNPDASLGQILAAVRLALAKLNALDAVEKVVQKVRARELATGQADVVWREAITAIDEAQSASAVHASRDRSVQRLRAIPQDIESEPLKVGIIGEIYVVLEPFVNMDVERELGRLGVEVHRTIMLSDWTRFTLFLNALGMSQHDKAHKAAMPYLSRDVGGDGWESVGETVLHAKEGYDGMVHLAPFTCMPEAIAQNIFIGMKQDVDIPVLTITCDEQMGRAGVVTRLEAYVDLLRRRKDTGRRSHARSGRVSVQG
jgi:predicted nucleotide-binding protein (sugar kinase/HSP70/actin superfamily)